MSDLIPPTKELPKPPSVPIVLEEETVLEPEAIEILKTEGFIEIGPNALSNHAKLGQALHGLGTIRVQRGRALINQQRLDASMRLLQEELEAVRNDKSLKRSARIKLMTSVAQTVGYLSGHITKSQALMVILEGGTSNIDASGLADDVTASFVPGSEVRPNQTLIQAREVHVHTPAPNPR